MEDSAQTQINFALITALKILSIALEEADVLSPGGLPNALRNLASDELEDGDELFISLVQLADMLERPESDPRGWTPVVIPGGPTDGE